MTDESQCDILTCLRSHLMEFHSTEYSWHNLRGTALDSLVKAAVLVPLVITDDNRVEVWLTQRSDNVSHDKGHISFPGGMKELGDANAVQTSLREATEEIGLSPDQVMLIINS